MTLPHWAFGVWAVLTVIGVSWAWWPKARKEVKDD